MTSGIAARKERDRARREELILGHAQRLLLQDGYQNLNLDRLAQAIEYSKGTLYLHFKSKEDLVLAVATRAAAERAKLFERAMNFSGRTRERARAIGFACAEFAINHRDYFEIDVMLKAASFWEKASPERRQAHSVQEARSFGMINGIVRDALRAGDLPPKSPAAEEITFSLFAITIGSHCAASQPDLQKLCAIRNPVDLLRRNQDVVCDGFGWQPLSTAWDFTATDRRINKEVFPETTWFKAKGQR